MDEQVILVDPQDRQIGTQEKMQAHREANLHRAFSIFVFNSQGQLMLQKRASGKYHCGGLWTNTVCSHPRPGESVLEGAHRKLKQEMGFDTELTQRFAFTYKAPFDNGLTEHEYDYVVTGSYDGEPKLNPEEAESWKWADPRQVLEDMKSSPEKYTPWFRLVLERVIRHMKNQ